MAVLFPWIVRNDKQNSEELGNTRATWGQLAYFNSRRKILALFLRGAKKEK